VKTMLKASGFDDSRTKRTGRRICRYSL